jgi:hypothetical protein
MMLTILPNQPKRPLLTICDDQLSVDVEFEPPEGDFEDNVRIALRENCRPELKLLAADEVAFSLTSSQARTLAAALLDAADRNDAWLAKSKV